MGMALIAQPLAGNAPEPALTVRPDNPGLLYSGRIEPVVDAQVTLGWSGARVRLRFTGTSVAMRMTDDTRENHVVVRIDGARTAKIRLDAADDFYPLASGLTPGEHTVEVVRVTEAMIGQAHFLGFVLDKTGTVLPWSAQPDRRILFVGDSITCGYGVEVDDANLPFAAATENFCDSYTGLTVEALKADYLVVSRSGIGMVRNYDGPRDGNPDAMPAIYPRLFFQAEQPLWDAARFVPQVICINLGTNDFSTAGVNQDKFVATYREFAAGLLTQYPHAKLVLIQGPMDNRAELRAALDRIETSLVEKFAGRVSVLVLSAQGEFGFGASYHPNRKQSQRNAAELTAYLAKLMGW